MNIIRRHGETGIPKGSSDDLCYVVRTWDWLLPRNGTFTTDDLALAIKRYYCSNNPKTAWCLGVLENISTTPILEEART